MTESQGTPEGRTVGDLMTRSVVCATREMSLDTLAAELVKSGLNGLPVIDQDGKVLGMVSKTDLLRLLDANRSKGKGTSFTLHTSHEVNLGETLGDKVFEVVAEASVGDIMTANPITVNEKADVAQAASLMSRERLHRLPVVSADDKVVGLISSMDVLRWVAAEHSL